MRMPRFRIRTMMFAVAVVACASLLLTRLGEFPILVLLGAVVLLPLCVVVLPILVVTRYYTERQWFVQQDAASEGLSGTAPIAREPRRMLSKTILAAAILCFVSTVGAYILRGITLSQERKVIADGHLFVVRMLEGWPDDAACGLARPAHTLSDPMWADSTSGRLAAYHRKLSAKYQRAARYPWLPVEPDPPPPE